MNSRFIFESFTARRAFLPAIASGNPEFHGLATWLCHSLGASDTVDLATYRYLIEDFRRDDRFVTWPSGMAVLQMLFRGLANVFSGINDLTEEDQKELEEDIPDWAEDFLTDKGAVISGERKVDALYRIRGEMTDWGFNCHFSKTGNF